MLDFINRVGIPVFIQLIIESWNSVFLFIMIFSLIMVKVSDRRANSNIPLTNELIIFYAALFLYNFFDIICWATDGDASTIGCSVKEVSEIGYFSVGAFQTLFFLQLVKNHVAKKLGMKILEKITTAFQLIHIPCLILLALTPITNALYYYDESNKYHRGQYFMVWYFATMLSFAFVAGVYLVFRKKIVRFVAHVIGIAAVLPIIAFIFNFFYTGISFNNIFVSVMALILFMLYERYRTFFSVKNAIELETVKTQLAENKLMLSESKNKVLMAQIQPHFINNSLMALMAQCVKEPEIYKNLSDFSIYLRSNFEALGDTKLITFEKEMENIEAYLSLEHRNFEDRLKVEYDIDLDDFLVPALSVQPLVENAVRHGIATYDKGGTVWIKAHKQDDNVIIEIVDDGSGRSNITPQQTKRKGIGIDNSRARIESMTDGSLDIITTDHGTTARVVLKYQKGE